MFKSIFQKINFVHLSYLYYTVLYSIFLANLYTLAEKGKLQILKTKSLIIKTQLLAHQTHLLDSQFDNILKTTDSIAKQQSMNIVFICLATCITLGSAYYFYKKIALVEGCSELNTELPRLLNCFLEHNNRNMVSLHTWHVHNKDIVLKNNDDFMLIIKEKIENINTDLLGFYSNPKVQNVASTIIDIANNS